MRRAVIGCTLTLLLGCGDTAPPSPHDSGPPAPDDTTALAPETTTPNDAAAPEDAPDVSAPDVVEDTAEPVTKVIPVFLMAGQSNMEGYGPIEDAEAGDWDYAISLKALIAMGEEDAGILDTRDDVWVTFPHGENRMASGYLRPGFGVHPGYIGPELGMGEVLGDAGAPPVVMYKAAWGGTTLGADWRPPSAGGVMGPRYEETMNGFISFRDTALTPAFAETLGGTAFQIAGFVWLQGWNDQFEDGFVPAYEDNLVALVTDVREALGIPDLPAIIVEGPTLDQALRDARQAAIARLNTTQPGRTIFVETEDLVEEETPGNFHFHFSARNYLAVGRRTGQAILDAGFVTPAP